jgi:hypothetical protein
MTILVQQAMPETSTRIRVRSGSSKRKRHLLSQHRLQRGRRTMQ